MRDPFHAPFTLDPFVRDVRAEMPAAAAGSAIAIYLYGGRGSLGTFAFGLDPDTEVYIARDEKSSGRRI